MALLKKLGPHLGVFLLFILVAVVYFYPILSGKKILQSDIVQYQGMARQQEAFRSQTNKEPYWVDNAFGGMPTYQLGARYPYHGIKTLDRWIRFLPRPADYLFLYFIGFYMLLICLGVDYRLGCIGSLAFGFSTYYIIILGVGHNAKAHAIGYMPMVLTGVLLIFRKKYIWGPLFLSIAMGLEIAANHFQMTYYLLLCIFVLGSCFGIDFYLKKEHKHLLKAMTLTGIAIGFGVLLNATPLLATQEYTQYSTRGDTGLTLKPNGESKKTSGLDYDYITEYSYGLLESFNLFVPRFMGGASNEKLGTDSNVYRRLIDLGARPSEAKRFAASSPTYWGDQTIVGAPAYIGAVVIFLGILSLFLVKGRRKWWLLISVILVLLLSWGKNFEFLTKWCISYLPLYNKFRAVSSIQVIAELCLPLLAMLGLQQLFFSDSDKDKLYKSLLHATIYTAGIGVILLLFSAVFSFSGPQDTLFKQQIGIPFVNALMADRKAIYISDTIRSIILVLATATLLWMYLKNYLQKNITILGIGILMVFDLVSVDWNYVNDTKFVSAKKLQRPFIPNTADREILKDTSHFRVLDLSTNPFNSARASYFHNAMGGYHAAKLGRAQELFAFYIAKGKLDILNLLNVKYLIAPSKKSGIIAQKNPNAFGNVWFTDTITFAQNTNEELLALSAITRPSKTVTHSKYNSFFKKTTFQKDSLAQVYLQTNQPNLKTYISQNKHDGFLVFSETFYPGWQAYIDQKRVDHLQVNYMQRGLHVPKGEHKIRFEFNPQVIVLGSWITRIASILLLLAIAAAIFREFQKKSNPQTTN